MVDYNSLSDAYKAVYEAKKAAKDYDGDGKVESGAKEHAGAVHNAIQKKKGLKPDGQDTTGIKEEAEEELDEGIRSALKKVFGKKESPAEKKPESRGEQLRKKYNVGPEKSDTSAKRQILNRSRARAERDEKEYGGSKYSKSVADKSKAAHDRYLKAGYSKYGAGDARGRGNKAHRRAAALKKEDFDFILMSLVDQGYDLTEYTLEEMYDICCEAFEQVEIEESSCGGSHESSKKKKTMKKEEVEIDEGLSGERYKAALKKGKMYSRMVSADPEKRATRGGRGGESDFGAGDRGAGNKASRRAGTYQQEEVELVDENRRAARSAGGYKDDSKKQPDPSKDGFTGIGNMSIDAIRKMSARIEKEKTKKESFEIPNSRVEFSRKEEVVESVVTQEQIAEAAPAIAAVAGRLAARAAASQAVKGAAKKVGTEVATAGVNKVVDKVGDMLSGKKKEEKEED